MDIEKNFEMYCEVLRSTNVDGVEDLISYLKDSDFKTAPASTNYHNNFLGGLCAHSLNVYQEIRRLVGMYIPKEVYSQEDFQKSVKLVALLHDISKAGFYVKQVQNRKDYRENGAHSDTAGKFDWIQVETYRVKDVKDRENLFGDHGLNSYMIASKFIKLTDDEAIAIINHHLSLDNNGRARTDISEILNRCPLATLLSLADTISAYIIENPYIVE